MIFFLQYLIIPYMGISHALFTNRLRVLWKKEDRLYHKLTDQQSERRCLNQMTKKSYEPNYIFFSFHVTWVNINNYKQFNIKV